MGGPYHPYDDIVVLCTSHVTHIIRACQTLNRPKVRNMIIVIHVVCRKLHVEL